MSKSFYDKLNHALGKTAFSIDDVRMHPKKLQTVIETVPDFFIASNDMKPRDDEAVRVIAGAPSGRSAEEKLVCTIFTGDLPVGFFELLFNYPDQQALEEEPLDIQAKLGELFARRLNLSYLVMHKDARGQGIGGTILNAIESVAIDLGWYSIHLVVDETNARAHNFYQRRGYEFIKTRVKAHDYLPRRADLVLMKRLQSSLPDSNAY